jgi:hypothetical protein
MVVTLLLVWPRSPIKAKVKPSAGRVGAAGTVKLTTSPAGSSPMR